MSVKPNVLIAAVLVGIGGALLMALVVLMC